MILFYKGNSFIDKMTSLYWSAPCFPLNISGPTGQGHSKLKKTLYMLNHWGRETHICVDNLTVIGSDNDLSAPSHHLNQCWNIVNWTLRNKLQLNFKQNSYTFIRENAFESVVCEMAAILSRPQCFKSLTKTWQSQFSPIHNLGLQAFHRTGFVPQT